MTWLIKRRLWKLMRPPYWKYLNTFIVNTYHTTKGYLNEVLVTVFDECEIGQIQSQVRNAWWIGLVKMRPEVLEILFAGHNVLNFLVALLLFCIQQLQFDERSDPLKFLVEIFANTYRPCALHPKDWARLETRYDFHCGIEVIQLEAMLKK